jgi:DNA-binding NarL/FixJ family response regulator
MRLLIADDSFIEGTGLTTLLTGMGHQVLGTAVRAEQVLPMVARTMPDLVVMDIRMPPTNTDEGIRLTAAIRDRHPSIAVLVLSKYVEPSYAATLLAGGVTRIGYLLKDNVSRPAVLQDAMTRIVAGGTAIEEELVAQLLRRPGDAALDSLTAREVEVLKLMAQGLSDRGIADRLGVSTATVSTHGQQTFYKLGLPKAKSDNRRVQAVLEYIRRTPHPPAKEHRDER